jgi:histidyl-tRNA synthetase
VLALRPEGTAGALRAVLNSGAFHDGRLGPTRPARHWYSGPMFRRERPQLGRYRQFTQLGVEHVGGGGDPLTDAETIALGWECLAAVGLAEPRDRIGSHVSRQEPRPSQQQSPPSTSTSISSSSSSIPPAPRPSCSHVELRINTLGDATSRASFEAALTQHFARFALGADSAARVARGAPLRVLDSRDPADAEAVATAPSMDDHLSPEAARRFDRVTAALAALEVPHVVDRALVRGLGYYTSTVFEFVIRDADPDRGQVAVLAGGRYDALSEALGAPARAAPPAIGWAMGVERCAELVVERAPSAIPSWVSVRSRHPHTIAVVADPDTPSGSDDHVDLPAACLALCAAIRQRRGAPAKLGLSVTCEYGDTRPLAKQLRDVDRAATVGTVVILGRQDVSRGTVRVKTLATGEQRELSAEAFLESLDNN